MPWGVGTGFFDYEFGDVSDLGVAVVFAGYQKRSDLHPDVGFLCDVSDGVEDGGQSGFAKFFVEVVAERFEVNVDGVQPWLCEVYGFGGLVAVANENICKPPALS